MKIGVFDSGLGGLFVLRGIIQKLPQYDYIYLGDTKRVPYGNRSQAVVYQFLEEAVEYLFGRGCALIIVACNTASAEALRRIQRRFLPRYFPRRRVLGVVIPAVEAVSGNPAARRVGVLGTAGTVASGAYVREFRKANPRLKVFQNAAPLLVPLIESDELRFAGPLLKKYLQPLSFHKIDSLVLACTHYPILKSKIKNLIGKRVSIVSQDEIVPRSLQLYLARHTEITSKLSSSRFRQFLATDITPALQKNSRRWFGGLVKWQRVEY